MPNFIYNIPKLFESNFTIADFLDIVIVAFIIYHALNFIHRTRAEQLFKGLLVLIAVLFISEFLKMYSVNWILSGVLRYGVIAAVIIFQPELRTALEYVGRGKFKSSFQNQDRQRAKEIVNDIVLAIDYFSTNKIGSIIVIERETALGDFIETGIKINSDISEELLKNIFYNKAPLHDGAVIIKKNRIIAAGCFLPLSETKRLSKDLGTRHRAALGAAERSDCLAIITSEERGTISMAEHSTFDGYLELKEVEKKLYDIYIGEINKKKGIKSLKNKMSFFSRK